MKAMEIFARFGMINELKVYTGSNFMMINYKEPATKMKESVENLKHFRKYADDEGLNILKIIKKASRSEDFYNNMDIIMVQSKINAKPTPKKSNSKKAKNKKNDSSPLNKSRSISYSTLPKLSMRFSSMLGSKPSHEFLNNSNDDKEDTSLLEKALFSHAQKYGKPTQTQKGKPDEKVVVYTMGSIIFHSIDYINKF